MPLRDDTIDGFDIAIFSARWTSREWATVRRGGRDRRRQSSLAHGPQVPLVVSEVNPRALARSAVASWPPNCTTMAIMPP